MNSFPGVFHLRRALWLVLFSLAVLCGTPGQGQPANRGDDRLWVPDGPILALAETNGILYIGGSFSHVRPLTGRFVPIRRDTGALLEPFEPIIGTIYVAIPDGSGGWFVGGIFNSVGSSPRTNIVHLLRDRSVDPNWILVANGPVVSAVLAGNRLFVGGHFTELNGQPRAYLAEVNPQSGELLPLDLALNGSVLSLAAEGSKLFLGGTFTSVAGQGRGRLAAVDLQTDRLLPWQADCDSLINLGVTLLTPAAGRLYVSGDFNTIGSSNRTRLAALDPATGRVLPWNVNLSGTMPAVGVAVTSNRVYIAGNFNLVGGVYRPFLAAVDRDTAALSRWDVPFTVGEVHAMTLVEDTIYLGGDLRVAGDPPIFLAAIDVATARVREWDPSPSAIVNLLAADGDDLYVGGHFDSIGGVARNHLAALNLATGEATSWNPRVQGPGVSALVLHGDSLFVGGSLASVGGQRREGLCAVSLSNGELLPFDANLRGNAGSLSSATQLALWKTNLFVGGSFASAASVPVAGFAVLDAQTGQRTGWNPAPSASVSAFAISQDQLYLSGTFSELDGQARNGLGAYELTSHQLADWRPTSDLPVEALYSSAGQVFLSGQFTQVNGQRQVYVASVDALTGQLNNWKPTIASRFVSMTTLGSTFYGVGNAGLRLAVDVIDGAVQPWAPVFLRDGLPAPIRSILATSRGLFVGGDFSDIDNGFHPWVAAFPVTNLAPLVSLIGPGDRAVLRLPGAVDLQAEAVDPDGAVARVAFYVNGNLVGVSAQAPYAIPWTPQIVSNYVIVAVAVDELGERGMSSSVHVTALPPAGDTPPTIELTYPEEGIVFPSGATLTLSAIASDEDSKLARVEFYLRTNRIAIVINPPYTTVVPNIVGGAYTATVRAIDEYGVSATHGPISFRVNSFPTVLWASPLPGAQIPTGTNVLLSVTARDLDGVIQSVSFFSAGTLLGTKTNTPFSLSISNLIPGNHTFTAEAQDDVGSVGVTPPLNVSVFPLPVNDLFAGRIALASPIGQASGSNNFASAEAGESAHVSPLAPTKSLWWSWTPDFTGPAFISTRGSALNTLLAVYTGETLPSLRRIASNDDERSGVITSYVTIQVTNGLTYQIAVDGRLAGTGAILLTVAPLVSMHATRETTPDRWTVRYTGPTNVTYVLQSSSNGVGWIPVGTNSPGANQLFLRRPPAAGPDLNRLLLEPRGP